MSLVQHTLRIEFSTEDAFRSEYVSNIANGGIFVASSEPIAVRDAVRVEIHLSYCDETVELEGEVVHRIPPEMSQAGAVPGVAVQFDSSVKELLGRFEPLVGAVEGNERISRSGRRAALRSPARVRATLTGAGGDELEGRSRDISSSGMLISVTGQPIAVGEAIVLTVSHPQTGEAMKVDGTVVRHLTAETGEVTAMGVEFHTPEARQTEVSSFMSDVRATEHSRRLGGITGPIAELGIENLLQMFGSSSPQGTLTVIRGPEEGYIVFEGGMLRNARVGPFDGADALRHMLSWREGSFEFEARTDPADLVGEPVPLSGAILDALCEIDEQSRATGEGAELSPDSLGLDLDLENERDLDLALDELGADGPNGSSSVPTRIGPESTFEVDSARVDRVRGELSKTEEAVLDLALVGLSVDKLVDVIPEPSIEVYRALDALLERGLIRCR